MGEKASLRFRKVLVEKPTAVVFVKDAGKAPWLVVEWLDVLNFNEENVSWFGRLDLEWTRQVVDLREINI
jgi:hypothetical protein